MSLINVISALGNNNSIYPLLVRDCGIENLAKCTMTYRQNAKESKIIAREATRERIIDEYGTSAVWLGGIPLMNKLMDKFIKKTGFAPEVNLKLFKNSNSQKPKAQSADINIEKFKNLAPEAVLDLKKIKENKNTYQNLQITKFFATTAIPIAVMGFLLPKLNFLYTKKKLEKQNIKKDQNPNSKPENSYSLKVLSMDEYQKSTNINNNRKNINFRGLEKLLDLSDLEKMMVLDGGLTVGRVKTGRGWQEKLELGFKMLCMCYLNYCAPKKIEKGLNNLTKRIFGLNTELDVKILNDKNFIKEIKNNSMILPKGNSEKEILDFIDTNSDSNFVKQLKNLNLVSFLENGIRDPRAFVETSKIAQFKQAIEEFAKDSIKSGSIEKFAKKALCAKSFNILTNVVLSSFLLAVMLPKIQFLFRTIITGSALEPGVKNQINKIDSKAE